MAKIMFIGDIVGSPGRAIVQERLPDLKSSMGVDAVVANAENAAGGSGLTAAIARNLESAGVDAITLGDHVWDQRGFSDEIASLDKVCRPANLPAQCPGASFLIVETGGFRLAVFTVLGRQYLTLKAECPFLCADRMLESLKGQCDAALVEVHAEATSEKIALGWYLDGRAAIIVGTHTHVPTADGRILPRGSAYMTDAGMTGPRNGVLGRETQPVVARFLDGMPRRFPVAEGDTRLCGCVIDIDPDTGLATSFERIEASESDA